jgi:hypothetical protein
LVTSATCVCILTFVTGVEVVLDVQGKQSAATDHQIRHTPQISGLTDDCYFNCQLSENKLPAKHTWCLFRVFNEYLQFSTVWQDAFKVAAAKDKIAF